MLLLEQKWHTRAFGSSADSHQFVSIEVLIFPPLAWHIFFAKPDGLLTEKINCFCFAIKDTLDPFKDDLKPLEVHGEKFLLYSAFFDDREVMFT